MDPLQDPSYLLSIIETIADSDHERSSGSIHNLLDAYATFVNRVRAQCQPLEASDARLPALVPLTVHKDNFIRALRRDVRLAHSDPFSTLSRRHSPLDETSVHLDARIYAKQYARDTSSLCHHAICTLTTICRFPALYSVFSDQDLSSLFGDVLDIILSDQLPVLNKAKTYSLSLWALNCHRLPVPALGSRRNDVFSALKRSLCRAWLPGNIIVDGLRAISHTVEHYSSVFLDILFPLLPHVIANLNCDSFEHRFHASIALGKFANALTHQTTLSLTKWQSLSSPITSFLESYCDDSGVASGDTSFSCMVRTAILAEPRAHHTTTPAWILAVLASLIILCGPTLYRERTVLRFILQSLGVALTHKRAVIRALHPHVWRCFVWTFSQMLFSSEHVEPAVISTAFYVIKQDVSGGIGVALVCVLLSDQISMTRSGERAERVSQAVSVVKAMIQAECRHTRREGFLFLQAFSDDAQARHEIMQNTNETPASVLLNAAIIQADWDGLPSTVHSIPTVPVSVQWPEEIELARHYKTLLCIWKDFAGSKHSDSGLVNVWMSILLACSRQIGCGQHIPATTEIPRYAAAIIVEFLPSAVLKDHEPDWGSWSVHEQLCSLTFIDQLWSAMRRAFGSLGLAEIAEFILTSILKYAFHVLDPDIRTSWGRLCADLMTTAPLSFLRDVHDRTIPQLIIRSQRELWGVVATSLSSSEVSLDWIELVKFLSIPICTWVLSGPELEAWEALLRNVVAVPGNSAMVIEHIVSQYFQRQGVETWDSIMAVLGLLLTYTRIHGNSPSAELLSTVDVCLTVYYSRARRSQEALVHALQLLNVIRCAIVSAPSDVMHILQGLSSSLCLWIEDDAEVMSSDDFNSVAVSLYCDVLKALEVLPLSIQSLQDMENFLVSAFSRIPTPAIAPFAFEKFWKATYHGQGQICRDLPPKIKSCLSCFVAAYGGDLADGLSLTTGSQSQSISNSSQAHSTTSHQYLNASKFPLRASSLSTPFNAGARADLDAAPYEYQHTFACPDDRIFLIPSPDALRPTVLHQLQEYTSRTDTSPLDGSERLMSSPRIPLSPIFPSNGAMPRSHSPENFHQAISNIPKQKRKIANSDGAPQKRIRTSQSILRSARKLESKPVTRDVTPVDVPCRNSVPLRKRKVFNGVQIPLHNISRRKIMQRTDTGDTINDTGQDSVSVPRTQSPSRRVGSRTSQSTLFPIGGSDEDDTDWEDFRVDATSLEADVDRSFAGAFLNSSLQTETSAPFDARISTCHSFHSTRLLDSVDPPRALSTRKAISQSERSPSATPRPSLRRTTLARLDALQDVYSSVANDASQIPWPELVQATKLVHQIGAVLTEQMGKKMVDPR